jgi:hypothetical protein
VISMDDFKPLCDELTRLQKLLADDGGQLTLYWFEACSVQFDRVRAEMDKLCRSERVEVSK